METCGLVVGAVESARCHPLCLQSSSSDLKEVKMQNRTIARISLTPVLQIAAETDREVATTKGFKMAHALRGLLSMSLIGALAIPLFTAGLLAAPAARGGNDNENWVGTWSTS